METKIVKVTNKGQISIPISIRKSANISEGDELFIVRNDNTILMERINKSDFKDLLKNSEKIAKKLWDNKGDEIWNSI